jgi:hypothetical protein
MRNVISNRPLIIPGLCFLLGEKLVGLDLSNVSTSLLAPFFPTKIWIRKEIQSFYHGWELQTKKKTYHQVNWSSLYKSRRAAKANSTPSNKNSSSAQRFQEPAMGFRQQIKNSNLAE